MIIHFPFKHSVLVGRPEVGLNLRRPVYELASIAHQLLHRGRSSYRRLYIHGQEARRWDMLVFQVKGDGLTMELFRISRRTVVREKAKPFTVKGSRAKTWRQSRLTFVLCTLPVYSRRHGLNHRDISICLLRTTLSFLKLE